jgi:predicted nucleotidyltransferase
MDYKIFNKNVLKIIEVLVDGREYFNEIGNKTKIKSKNNLLSNLNLLVEHKILIKEENKLNTFYYLNYNNSITISIIDLLDKIKFEKLPFNIKKSINQVIFKLNPKLVILFGSYAKNNYNIDSDIDLLFFDSKKDYNAIKEISDIYGCKLNIIFMSFNKINLNSDSFKHILKTGYPLIGTKYFYNEKNKI